MSLFGSREEDPLLQDDPLAPPRENDSSENDANGDSSNEEGPPEERTSNGSFPEASSSESTADEHFPSAPTEEAPTEDAENEEREDSVFRSTAAGRSNTERAHFRFDGGEDTRVIIRSAEEAAEGRLTVLNAAFEEGWSLDRVEMQEEDLSETGTDGDEASSTAPSIMLAFVLQRPGPK